jgi:hypothetical protein
MGDGEWNIHGGDQKREADGAAACGRCWLT